MRAIVRAIARALLLSSLPMLCAPAWANLSHSLFTISGEPRMGLANESELGLYISSGNSPSSSLSGKQKTSYRWTRETVQGRVEVFRTTANRYETAFSWMSELRFEESLAPGWGAYFSENLSSNAWAGFRQRYTTDAGIRREIWNEDTTKGAIEAGYQYQLENRTRSPRFTRHVGRTMGEASYKFNDFTWGVGALEVLPNLVNWRDLMINGELSLETAMGDLLSIKWSYSFFYTRSPPSKDVRPLDSYLFASLKARF